MPNSLPSSARRLHLGACASLIALIFLCLAWELRLAPIQPGGSWLVLKCAPLLAPLFGVLHGRRYTCQWASLLILLYLAEGVVRATTDHGISRWLATGEIALSLAFFATTIGYVRASRAPRAAD